MSNVRLRRLTADYEKLQNYVRLHPRVKLLQAEGDPPERYQLEYRIKSLRMVNGELEPIKDHLVEITLPRNYPRTPPQCRMLSPVFHPNVAPHAICVGDHWSAGESLQSIVMRIGEMLAYQSYNVKSPLNGEAARWVEEHGDELPLDRVSLLVDETAAQAMNRSTPSQASGGRQPPGSVDQESVFVNPRNRGVDAPRSPKTAPKAPVEEEPVLLSPEPETFQTQCPWCQAKYVVRANVEGRKVRCKKCLEVFEVTSPDAVN